MRVVKNGFTLIEMIGVVTILAVIMLISAIPVTRTLKSMNDNAFDKQLTEVLQAAKLWGQEHPEEMPTDEFDTNTIVDLNTLIDDGYLEGPIQNPKTKKNFNNIKIQIMKKGKRRYNYKIIDIDGQPYQSEEED